jgi:metal-responsive CopG/Arc/MetJ family transcriptional regulator
MWMKAIQITMDESLLAALDGEPDVEREGRSAVIRRAVKDYLERRRADRIAQQYRQAYRRRPATEFAAFEQEQVWPEE